MDGTYDNNNRRRIDVCKRRSEGVGCNYLGDTMRDEMKKMELEITNTSMADDIHVALLTRQAKLLYECLRATVNDLSLDDRGRDWEDLLCQAEDLNAVLRILSGYEPNANWHRGPDELEGCELVAIIKDPEKKKKKGKGKP